MGRYFPGVATLCKELDEFWYKKLGYKMEFGLFYTMAINVDINGERVKSIPHRDARNLAWGVCAIFPFGEFYTLPNLIQCLTILQDFSLMEFLPG